MNFFTILAIAITLLSACFGSAEGALGGLLLGGLSLHGPNIRDAAWEFTKALPAAAATASFTAIDLETVNPEKAGDGGEWELDIPATPALVTPAAPLILQVYTTAGAATSLTGVDPHYYLSIPGVATTGASAKVVRFRLPSTAKRYLRATAFVTSGGGDNTAVTVTLRRLF